MLQITRLGGNVSQKMEKKMASLEKELEVLQESNPSETELY